MIPNLQCMAVTADEGGGRPAFAGTRVYHRNFPELHVEGRSPRDGALRLTQLIVRDLDWTSDTWRRATLQQALDDVRTYAASVPPAGP